MPRLSFIRLKTGGLFEFVSLPKQLLGDDISKFLIGLRSICIHHFGIPLVFLNLSVISVALFLKFRIKGLQIHLEMLAQAESKASWFRYSIFLLIE